jgi:hypothetical protein
MSGEFALLSPSHTYLESALLWNGTQFIDKKLDFFGFNAIEPYNATHWPHIPCCHDKCNPWCPHNGASWEHCIFASLMAINVAGYKLVYWSYNGNSETNIMGYWTTPLVGPDRGPFSHIYGSSELLLLISM